jgi:EmrB/QacA subfamily drug resistance transporter
VDSYTLVFAALLLSAGLLADRLGRKLALFSGLVVFGGFSVWSAYSHSSAELIAARAGMGIGGALVLPATLAIIVNVFPAQERPKAIGIWAGSAGLAVAIGPITGGILLEHFWWGSVFLINVPIVLVGAIATLVVVPESKDPARSRFDPFGVLLSVVGLSLLVYGVIKGGELDDWTAKQVWGNIAGGLGVLIVFILWERRTAHPAMDVGYFRNRQFSAAVAATGLIFFALMGATFFLVFYLQSVRGYSALKAGTCLLPLAIAQLVFAPQATVMVRRFGVRLICTTGMLLNTAAFGGMYWLGRDSSIWILEGIFFVMGVGMAYVMPPATAAVMATLPSAQAGAGSAVNNTLRQVGGALGVAILGSVLSSAYRRHIRDDLAPLPARLRDVAEQSIEGTLGVAAHLRGPIAGRLVSAASDSFIPAMHITSLVAAGVTLFGAVVTVVFLPGRQADESMASSSEVHVAIEA